MLIREMEQFRERTGMGLAGTWGYVHREEYEEAHRDFARIKDWYGKDDE